MRGNETETVRQGRAGQGGWLAGNGACAGMGSGSREEVQKVPFCAEGLGWVGLGWVGLAVGWKGVLDSLEVWKEGLEGRFGRKKGGGDDMGWVGGEKIEYTVGIFYLA